MEAVLTCIKKDEASSPPLIAVSLGQCRSIAPTLWLQAAVHCDPREGPVFNFGSAYDVKAKAL